MSIGGVGGGVDPYRFQSSGYSSDSLEDEILKAKQLVERLIEEGKQGNANELNSDDYNAAMALLDKILNNPRLGSLGSQTTQ